MTKKPLNTWIATASVAVMVMFMGARAGHSAAFYCANCSTEWTQLLNKLELVKQLEQQIKLVENAINRYKLMIQNTIALPTHIWSKALEEIQKLNSLLSQAKSLSYTLKNLDSEFSKKYRTYSDYVSSQIGSDDLEAKYKQWSEDTNDAVKTTLKAAGLQSEQIEGSEDTYLKLLEGQSEAANGHMKALQTANQITIATARQLQKLRQLILMQLQLQANYMQMQMDREAVQAAAWKNFTQKPKSMKSGKKY